MVPPYAMGPTPYSCVVVAQYVDVAIFCAKSCRPDSYG